MMVHWWKIVNTIVISLTLHCSLSSGHEKDNIVHNKCDQTIWVGANSPDGRMPTWWEVEDTGFELKPGQSRGVRRTVDTDFRIWGRTKCNSKGGNCETGDCGRGTKCGNNTGKPPLTFVDLYQSCGDCSSPPEDKSSKDGRIREEGELEGVFFVGLSNGFNLPMTIVYNGCKEKVVGCNNPTLLKECPTKLQHKNKKGKVIGCSNVGGNNSKANPEWKKYVEKKCPQAKLTYGDNKDVHCLGYENFNITFC